MAYRVGAELADMFSAIAPVSGPLALLDIAPSREISVVHFHGSLDQFTPLDGGIGRRSVTRVSHRGILAGLLDFVRTNGCPPDPMRETICENQDGISIERYSWGPGKLLSSVVFYRIEGGGHTWPGQKPDSFFLGNTSLSLSWISSHTLLTIRRTHVEIRRPEKSDAGRSSIIHLGRSCARTLKRVVRNLPSIVERSTGNAWHSFRCNTFSRLDLRNGI